MTSLAGGESSLTTKILSSSGNKLLKALSEARLLVPLALLLALTLKEYYTNDFQPFTTPFKLVPQQQFIPAMSGFVSIRFALFLSEVTKEIRSDDWLSFIPGSIAETVRRYRDGASATSVGPDGEPVVIPQPIVFVTGPAAAGRTQLFGSGKQNLADPGLKSTPLGVLTEDIGRTFDLCTVLTTSKAYKDITGADGGGAYMYKYVSEEELEKMVNGGQIAYAGVDRGADGSSIDVFLPYSSVLYDPKGSAGGDSAGEGGEVGGGSWRLGRKAPASVLPRLLVGPPDMLDTLRRLEGVLLTNVWVSLRNKEQFEERATELLAAEGVTDSQEALQTQVSGLLGDAVQDINFYMQRAMLFQYTLQNSASGASTVLQEMKLMLKNMKN